MSTFLFLNNIRLDILNFDNDFVLLRSKESEKLVFIGEAILKNKFEFIDEVIATEREICLKVNKKFEFQKLAQFHQLTFASKSENRILKVPVYFKDHTDWKTIADHTSLSKTTITNRLKAIPFSVAMLGFLPGFIYLNGLPNELQIPRKNTPSKYIEANSLAIGGPYLGIYSLPSPGGWNVIGKIACSILNIPALPPIQIKVNDTLMITEIDQSTYHSILNNQTTLMEYNGIA